MKNYYFTQKTSIYIQKCNKLSKVIIGGTVLLVAIILLVAPRTTSAQVITIDGINISNLSKISTKIDVAKNSDESTAVITSKKPAKVVNMVITAYTSHAAQTDSTPCITASGLDVCERGMEDIVATNFNWLPFGTKIKIPELFGDRVFIIHDRMNSRYSQRVDVWMKSYAEAVKFGKKYASVEIYN